MGSSSQRSALSTNVAGLVDGGNGASVLRIVPYAALHFMTYERYRDWILDNYSALGTGPVIDLLAGSASGGTAVLCTYPLDLARTKLAYQFYIYEELKRHVPEDQQKSIMMRLSCGALAGLFGQTLTYPLDVVRRQMQVEHLRPSIQGGARYRSTMQGLATIVRNQGWTQLFAGLSINYIKIVPSVAIGFTVYDSMKSSLNIPPRQKSQPVSTA
ncbi:hypothetical protein C3L33_08966, partial [Rhododendron williamsianum]